MVRLLIFLRLASRPLILGGRRDEILSSGNVNAEAESTLVLTLLVAILLKMLALVGGLGDRTDVDDVTLDTVVLEPGRVFDDTVEEMEAVLGV